MGFLQNKSVVSQNNNATAPEILTRRPQGAQHGVNSNVVGIQGRSKPRLESGHPFARVTALDRTLIRKMLAGVGNPPVSISLWDGVEVVPTPNPVARLHFHDRGAVLKLIMDPELHFGDLYSGGRVEFQGDMVKFLEAIFSGIYHLESPGWLRKMLVWLGHRRIANSMSRARDNIYHHYDIGNDFYQLWLDTEAMQYTCAYFPDAHMSLEEAQVAKLHHVCRKLQLKPGDSVVEAGCGWGGLARFMARHYGVRVKAYNISRRQVQYAREEANKQGLSDKVEYVEDDYRNIDEKFDVFVSVGMLEHVGRQDYGMLGDVIDRCLKPDGRGLIHTIGRNLPGPMNAWMERRIFPGAYPPTLREMMQVFEPNNFTVLDVENLRLHYVQTLQHWWQRFEHHKDKIEVSLDAAFVRAWRLYLTGAIAAFNCGELQLFQVTFNRYHNRQPWSRAHLYTQQEGPV